MKKQLLAAALLIGTSFVTQAADYVIDYKGAHASINFKVKHLGYSWLTGRFNVFDGNFSFDENNINNSKITVNIDTSTVDSNHAERDKHLRGGKYLEVNKYSKASFVSNKIEDLGNNKIKVTGTLSLHGSEKIIVIDAYKIGEGKDPWGGYRAGFSGTTSINMSDFGFKKDFGEILFDLHIEGIKQ